MPPKRRTAIGRSTNNAKRLKKARASETSENRNVRLASDRERHAEARSVESSESRAARLNADREYHAEARASETRENREERWAADRERHAEARSVESSENRAVRLDADREYHAEVRSSETIENREERWAADRERHAEARSVEASEIQAARKSADGEYHAATRSSETTENREERWAADRERHAEARSVESKEQRSSRRHTDRERQAERRSAESSDNRQARLEADRQHHTQVRSSEPSDLRAVIRANDRERHATRTTNADLKHAAFRYNPYIHYHQHPNVAIGSMDKLCLHCNALKFANESPGMCCAGGKVKLPELSTPPEPLSSLVSGDTRLSKLFLRNIRKYNSCFQMTSFGAGKIVRDNFMPTFKIQGQVYHQARSLLPMPDTDHTFLQIYFMGNIEEQTDQRCRYIRTTEREIVAELEIFFQRHNELVKLFRTALDRMPTDEYVVVIRADKTPVGQHERQYNAPTIDEVAIVLVGEGFEKRDVILQRRGGDVQFISETHRCYDALQYPILFWQGEDGYHFNIKMINPATGEETNKKVSAMNYYAYRLMIRQNTDNHLLKCRALLHQYIVDMYAKIESERLLYIRLNQSKLRSEEYIHLRDAINNDANIDPNQLGKAFILPATFTGSPRHMHEYAQDAMTYVRAYGRPDLFITFTCNPRWIEIKELLIAGQ
nr:uncharacterized protein LOC115255455 [Aedes albopictus]